MSKNKIGDFEINKVYLGDSLEMLKKIPDNTIDLIFADPPYNLQLNGELYRPNQTKVDAVNDEWDKFPSMKDYDNFSRKWLSECYRVLKKSGSIWVIGTYHNIFRVGSIMQDIGYWLLNDIIWIKTNPMPNFKGTRFNNAHETLIWATKSKESKYTFHYQSLKSANDDLQMRSDWYIPICQGEERIKVNGRKAHSTQKPAELLYRIIISTSNIGDIILDPFCGSGTTAAVAKRLGRNFITFDKDEFYVKISTERINKIKPIEKTLLEYKIEVKKPKVPFINLIEKGFVKIGEHLYSKNKKYKAIVLANGTIEFEGQVGSIHKISAKLLNKENNNGWTYWYVLRNNQLISIDQLRFLYEEKFLSSYRKKYEMKETFNDMLVSESNNFLEYGNNELQ